MPTFTWLQIEVLKMQSIEMHCFLLLYLASIELSKVFCPKLLMLIGIPLGIRKATIRWVHVDQTRENIGGGEGGGAFLKTMV
jgi:hypothetical protein